MSRGEDGLEHGWDRADADQWAPRTARSLRPIEETTEPELPAVRVWVIVAAIALIVVGGTVGALGRVPGAVNGGDLLALICGVAGIALVLREIRR